MIKPVEAIIFTQYRFRTNSDAKAVHAYAKKENSFRTLGNVHKVTTSNGSKTNESYNVTIATTPYFKTVLEDKIKDSNISYETVGATLTRLNGGKTYDYLMHYSH